MLGRLALGRAVVTPRGLVSGRTHRTRSTVSRECSGADFVRVACVTNRRIRASYHSGRIWYRDCFQVPNRKAPGCIQGANLQRTHTSVSVYAIWVRAFVMPLLSCSARHGKFVIDEPTARAAARG